MIHLLDMPASVTRVWKTIIPTHRIKEEYSRTSVMWTPEGRPKSVHNSKVSTLVKLSVAMATVYIIENKRAGQKLSTVVGCPQRWGVHRARFYCS